MRSQEETLKPVKWRLRGVYVASIFFCDIVHQDQIKGGPGAEAKECQQGAVREDGPFCPYLGREIIIISEVSFICPPAFQENLK
jgi:hypothetical protein